MSYDIVRHRRSVNTVIFQPISYGVVLLVFGLIYESWSWNSVLGLNISVLTTSVFYCISYFIFGFV